MQIPDPPEPATQLLLLLKLRPPPPPPVLFLADMPERVVVSLTP